MSTNIHFDLLAKVGYTARGIVFIVVFGPALFSGIAGGKADTKQHWLRFSSNHWDGFGLH